MRVFSKTEENKNAITVFVVDDRDEVHEGITLLFQRQKDCSIVGHARDGREAFDRIRQIQPDIVLLDIKMPSMSGIEVAKSLMESKYVGKIIFLSQYGEEEYIRGAIEAGACGYILKEQMHEVLTAIRLVEQGEYFFSSSILRSLALEHNDEKPVSEKRNTPALTRREKEILQLLMDGLSSDEIAKRTSLNKKTIEFHVANLKQKLGGAEFVRRNN